MKEERRLAVPSWCLSVVFHAALLVVLAILIQPRTPKQAAGERTAEVGIALKSRDGERTFFETESNDTESAADATAGADTAGPLLSEGPPSDPTDILPKPMNVLGPGAIEEGGAGSAAEATAGPSARRALKGGGARVGLFGTEGEGFKFVYVFDRSESMGGSGRNALRAAKTELKQSLETLDINHQFQVIFYNETPVQFNPAGRPGKLAFGNEQNKHRAVRFIDSIIPSGGTEHEPALMLALKLQPDVVFFLTDGDEPGMSPAQLAKIRRYAAGTVINTIEFGVGPKQGGFNFLQRLASQNGGKYAYVDILKLLPRGGGKR
jgi:hypothetical protein